MTRPKVVVFGGTFDPVFSNHVIAIRRLLEEFRTVVIATGDRNPFKSWAPSPLADRLEMMRMALEAEKIKVVEDPHEAGVVISKAIYWYAHEFVEQFRSMYPDLPIAWAVGSDIANEVARWKNWEAVNAVSPVEIFVLERDPKAGSSTEIREGRLSPHPATAGYIREKGLYPKVRPFFFYWNCRPARFCRVLSNLLLRPISHSRFRSSARNLLPV